MLHLMADHQILVPRTVVWTFKPSVLQKPCHLILVQIGLTHIVLVLLIKHIVCAAFTAARPLSAHDFHLPFRRRFRHGKKPSARSLMQRANISAVPPFLWGASRDFVMHLTSLKSSNADQTWAVTGIFRRPGSEATFRLHFLRLSSSRRTVLSDRVLSVLLFLPAFSCKHLKCLVCTIVNFFPFVNEKYRRRAGIRPPGTLTAHRLFHLFKHNHIAHHVGSKGDDP